MDPEIIALVREAVASVVRDLPQGNVDVGFVDDMIRTSERTEVFEGEGLDSVGTNDNKPWTFENGTWKNQIVQFGYDVIKGPFQDTTGGSDGVHYLRADAGMTGGSAISIVLNKPSQQEEDVVYVRIGEIRNGTLVDGIHVCPVIYFNI